MSITISKELCISCLKCVRVCPASIVEVEGRDIVIRNEERCIACGHCVAACEHSAFIHPEFPKDKIHGINMDKLPSPEQLMELIRSRRSNRAFSRKKIPAESLDMIVEAAYRAPTASNKQQLAFTLVTNPSTLKIITEFTLETFGSLSKIMGNPFISPFIRIFRPDIFSYIAAFKRMQLDYTQGKDRILRSATAILLIHSPKGSRFAVENANLAYQNASLMAESLGVAQFYTGFVQTAVQRRRGVLEKRLGIDGAIGAGMALAMPAFTMKSYIDRKEIKITRVE